MTVKFTSKSLPLDEYIHTLTLLSTLSISVYGRNCEPLIRSSIIVYEREQYTSGALVQKHVAVSLEKVKIIIDKEKKNKSGKNIVEQ